jgi:hypothetical protein
MHEINSLICCGFQTVLDSLIAEGGAAKNVRKESLDMMKLQLAKDIAAKIVLAPETAFENRS